MISISSGTTIKDATQLSGHIYESFINAKSNAIFFTNLSWVGNWRHSGRRHFESLLIVRHLVWTLNVMFCFKMDKNYAGNYIYLI